MYLPVYILKIMAYRSKLGRWGNSFAVRIPAHLIKELELSEGETLLIEVQGKEMVVKPDKGNRLEDLIGEITPQNVHGEVDWGKREGNEVW